MIDDFAHKRDRHLCVSTRQVPDVTVRSSSGVGNENVGEIGFQIVGARSEADGCRVTEDSREGIFGHNWQWCRRSRSNGRVRGKNWGEGSTHQRPLNTLSKITVVIPSDHRIFSRPLGKPPGMASWR